MFLRHDFGIIRKSGVHAAMTTNKELVMIAHMKKEVDPLIEVQERLSAFTRELFGALAPICAEMAADSGALVWATKP